MCQATRANARLTGRRWRGSCFVAAELFCLLVLFAGCSSERRYKVLSFFFDGVPNPNAPAAGTQDEFAAQRAGGVAIPIAYTHKPYAENKCSACHENATGRFDDFQKLESSICLRCHQDVTDKYPVMHGPVAAAECNLCHVPHESSIPKLLRDTAPAVCVQCHQSELLSPEPPEHLMADKSCLECHSGHGGAKHGLLKSGIALKSWSSSPSTTTLPATVPTPAHEGGQGP